VPGSPLPLAARLSTRRKSATICPKMCWLSACNRLSHDQLAGIKLMAQAYRPLPSAENLKIFLRYEPETGDLWRIACLQYKRSLGRNVIKPMPPRAMGRVDDWGYLRCDLLGLRNLQVSRVIWRLTTGEDPGQRQIDHINRVKTDNRWINLRLAEQSENQWNTGQQRGKGGCMKLSSHKGVSYVRDRNGEVAYIIARISANGMRHYLGVFPTEEAAHAAYCAAAKILHGEFARTK
jgi:hypothetical protein